MNILLLGQETNFRPLLVEALKQAGHEWQFPATRENAVAARQRLLPLGKTIERFGAAIVAPVTFTLTGFAVGGPSQVVAEVLLDDFAPGQFTGLTDDQRVTRPAFEAMQSGGRVQYQRSVRRKTLPTARR